LGYQPYQAIQLGFCGFVILKIPGQDYPDAVTIPSRPTMSANGILRPASLDSPAGPDHKMIADARPLLIKMPAMDGTGENIRAG